ncbi:hypothetical protein Q5P01_023568 [Channa striata]|uniref:ATP synthase membrane subunit f n=1 Tax=Channa striata TaxID=64152 RepID=A0AA88LKC7_CHASR|nr:hypothetical protein Q5P01_023568 [Channa striata]
MQTVDGPSDLTPVIVPAERQKGGYKGTAKSLTDIMPNTSSQQAQLLSDKENYLKSDQGSSVPLPVLQPKLNSPAPSLLSGPLVSQFSSPHPFLLPPPVRVDTSRADEASSPEKSQVDVGKQNTANSQPGGAVTQLRLGQVRLRELPEWLACKTPRNPKHVVEMVQRGWQWYHRRYINVKKGGVGGLGMLLAGYCVLSYIWSYPRIKLDRWRKYH